MVHPKVHPKVVMTIHRKRPASMVCLPLWSSNSVDDKFLNGKLFWCMMMKVTDVNVMYILPSNSLATCDQHPWTKVPHITHRFAKLYFGKPWNETKKNLLIATMSWVCIPVISGLCFPRCLFFEIECDSRENWEKAWYHHVVTTVW